MSRYKVGDIVTVRSDLREGESYYMDDGNNYNNVITEMLELRGKTVRISRVDRYDGQYQLYEDLSGCYWTDEMFESMLPAENDTTVIDDSEMVFDKNIDELIDLLNTRGFLYECPEI